jgi:HEAT repeat protein
MNAIPIKKLQKKNAKNGTVKEVYAVPSVAIDSPNGKILIPNPSGREAAIFASLEEAEEAVRRAGFDYEFEGKTTYTMNDAANHRAVAARLGIQPMDAAVPLLIEQLKDREPSVLANAAFALGALRAGQALESLLGLLGHDDPSVRKNTAEALARLGLPGIPRLRQAYETALSSNHKNAPYIRLTVINAFLEMLEQGTGVSYSDQYLSLAVQALSDDSWLVKSQAALLLGRTAQAIEVEKNRPAGKSGLFPDSSNSR